MMTAEIVICLALKCMKSISLSGTVTPAQKLLFSSISYK